MKFHIIFAVLISFYILSAEATLWDMISNIFSRKQYTPAPLSASAPASLSREYPALELILTIENECVKAPYTISQILKLLKTADSTKQTTVKDIVKPGTKVLFLCPAEDEKEDKIMESWSIKEQLLFFRDEYKIKANKKENGQNGNAEPQREEEEENGRAPIEDTRKLKTTNSNFEVTEMASPSSGQDTDEYENNRKCVTPIKPLFFKLELELENGSIPSYEIFATGFQIYMDKYSELSIDTLPGSDEKIRLLNVLIIMFDSRTLDVKSVSYSESGHLDILDSSMIDTDPPITADYGFGKFFLYGNLDIGKLYEIDNQRTVFSKLFPNEAERSIYFDETNKVLVKAHLAPLNTCLTGLSQQAAQTYGNIAPMWQAVKSYSWNRVEKFINKLATDLGPLHIMSGTYEVLNLASSGPIFLSSKNKVRVPLAFYKIVEYARKKTEIYTMVLVVINNPYEVMDTMSICEVNECQKYGWGLLENDDFMKGVTYCCPITQDIINLLGLEDTLKIGEVLDLNEFTSIDISKYNGIFGD